MHEATMGIGPGSVKGKKKGIRNMHSLSEK